MEKKERKSFKQRKDGVKKEKRKQVNESIGKGKERES